jgi:large subunit ribosomal protein L18
LTVFRSNKHVYAQIIDDVSRKTLVSAADTAAENKKMTKSERATFVGTAVAKAALQKKITKVCFDRGHYQFLGRVKTLAQAAREAGLEF